MTAASADFNVELKDGVYESFPVKASTKIYGGTFVCVDANGYALPGADTAGLIFQGICMDQADNSSGSNGDKNVTLRRRGLVKATFATAISQANVGDNVFLADDQNVDVAANLTNDIFCGVVARYIDTTHAWIDIEPAIRQADVATHIADVLAAHAASAISIADAGGFTAQVNLETATQEMYAHIPAAITDPGDAGAIPVARSGNCAITTTGAETRTLAIPSKVGTVLALSMDVDGGDCVIAAAAAINQTGNNRITLNDAGDTVVLVGVQVGAAKVWRVVVNDGATLATV